VAKNLAAIIDHGLQTPRSRILRNLLPTLTK